LITCVISGIHINVIINIRIHIRLLCVLYVLYLKIREFVTLAKYLIQLVKAESDKFESCLLLLHLRAFALSATGAPVGVGVDQILEQPVLLDSVLPDFLFGRVWLW